MKKHLLLPGLITAITLLLLSPAAAQTRRRHSLSPSGDSARVFLLLDEAEKLKDRSLLDSADRLCGQALQLSTRLKDSFLIALSCYGLGQVAQATNRKEDAMMNFQRALSARLEKDQSAYTARVYNDIGYLYGSKGELDTQREWYLKAMRLYDGNRNSSGMAETLSNLSGSSLELGRKKEAMAYAMRALAIRERLQDKEALSLSYNNLSQIYLQMDSVEQAIRCQQEGLRYASLSGSKKMLAQNYTSMSLLMNRQGKNQEALEYEKKTIAICKETGNNNMLSRRYIAAAILSGKLKDSIGAVGFFDESAKVAGAIDDKYNLRDLYLYRTIFYKERKDYYRAYESLKLYHAYKDSIIDAETSSNIAEIQARYETEKKDKSIGELEASEKIKQLEIEKQKATIAGSQAVALRKENEISLLSQSRELQDVKIAQQKEELNRKELAAKSKDQALRLAAQQKTMLIGGIVLLLLIAGILFNRYQLKKRLEQQQALLEIRNKIARDLHDEVGSTLTSIHILSQVSRNHLEDVHAYSGTSSLLQKITDQSRQMQQSMSDIVWAIRSDNDNIGNMMVRMREYLAQTLEAKDIAIGFQAGEELLGCSFTMQQRKDIFLIFKEAVNNAAKYAGCTRMDVLFHHCRERILLEIRDNGIGFDLDKVRSSSGLKNMRARAASLEAGFCIETSPGKGTMVRLDLPATT